MGAVRGTSEGPGNPGAVPGEETCGLSGVRGPGLVLGLFLWEVGVTGDLCKVWVGSGAEIKSRGAVTCSWV